ncbi:MAG TPA: hypothetical protein VGN86_01310, partial [Pyrinomonadaceae bacterium]|nr:hypothetical protein [Pyrinomonadaceae bacterium]
IFLNMSGGETLLVSMGTRVLELGTLNFDLCSLLGLDSILVDSDMVRSRAKNKEQSTKFKSSF